ncbi:unnamed protein product, partial [marine sediment metagenome]
MKKNLRFIKTNADLLIVLIIGLTLRLKIILRDDLWYDEAFTGLLMRIPKDKFLEIIKNDPHPPLYMLINKLWILVFGVSDFSLRFLPLKFGILTIIIVYLLTKKLFQKETAVVAAFLAAINPFLIGYSIEARSYSFFGFITALTAYFLITKHFNLFVLALVVMLNTHFMSLTFMPVLLSYYVYLIFKGKLGWKKEIPRLATILIVLSVTYFFGINNKPDSLNTEWIRRTSFKNIQRSITAYSYGVKTKLAGKDEVNNLNFFVN